MYKIIGKTTAAILFFLVSSPYLWAAGPANLYEVRIAKMELYNGSSWITVFEGTSTAIDIAGVSSGQKAGTFLSGLAVPDGTYTQSRVTPSQTFGIKGNDGSGRYTTATIGSNGGCEYSTDSAQEAKCELTISIAITPKTETFPNPITVSNGAPNYIIKVSFDTSEVIEYNGVINELLPAAPTVAVTTSAIE